MSHQAESHWSTASLAASPLFQTRSESLKTYDDRVQLAFARARAVANAYKLTSDDILNVSPRYWQFHTDPILVMDGAVGTLLTIQMNLCAGTLAVHQDRPDVRRVLDKILSFEINGQYMLTELGHGLDAINLETTVTLLPNGELELHTPSPRGAKYMPPTSPSGMSCLAVVFARLIVGSRDLGVKPFIVPIHDGKSMHEGVSCKVLTPRGGSRPVKHCLTYFNRVRLPGTALLGSQTKAKDVRLEFFNNISRVISGTLSMGAVGLSAIRLSAYIAGKYSLRRTVTDTSTLSPIPVISFPTQHIPILTAVAQSFVIDALSHVSRELFVASKAIHIRHFVACVFKIVALDIAKSNTLILGDRCGAQGLQEANLLSVMHSDMRGASVAEGDILTISIRFAMEVILGRISPPAPVDTEHILYKHEKSMIEELRGYLASAKDHRDAQVQAIILPQCQPLIEAIGHRMAYDAAVRRGIEKDVLNMFVASVVQRDPAWYTEHAGLDRTSQRKMEFQAASVLLPRIEVLLRNLGAEAYANVPLLSDNLWETYVDSLETVGVVPVAEGRLSTDANRQVTARL